MTLDELQIGNVYSFEVYAPQFLAGRFGRLVFEGGVNAALARKFDPIDQLYEQVFPALPEGTPHNVNRTWYIFKQLNGTSVAICDQWVIPSSLALIESTSFSVYLPNLSLSDEDKIRVALKAAGFSDFSITQV